MILEEVALRKESVDRNSPVLLPVSILIEVALRKESVDRNNREMVAAQQAFESLSARRAWIEISDGVANLS